jgi:hypothetical protein
MTYSREQLRELMPLYVNGSLSPQVAEDFLRAIEQHDDLMAELDEFSDISAAFDSRPLPDEDHFQALFEKIDTGNAVPVATKQQPAAAGGIEWLKNVFLRPWLSWGLVLAQFALIAVIVLRPPADEPRYETLSHGAPQVAQRINVVFSEHVSVQDMNRLLRSHGLAIVSGPSASGMYVLSLPADSDPRLLSELERSSLIRFVDKAM